MAELSVRPMTEAEFQRWRRVLAEAYAAEQVAAGNWAPEEALVLSLEGHEAMLPTGLATAGMLLLHGVRADGTPVGVLWIGLTHPRRVPDTAFLYDIEIAPEHRGEGYGRALLAAAEDAVRAGARHRPPRAERLR